MKSIAIGSCCGAVILVLLDLFFSEMLRSITPANVFHHMSAPWFVREASLGAILGASTYSSLVMMRAGRRRQAANFCVIGGALMTLWMIAQITYISLLTFQAVGSGKAVNVPGPQFLAPPIRATLLSLMFNVPFQWALGLVVAGLWIYKTENSKKQNATLICG